MGNVHKVWRPDLPWGQKIVFCFMFALPLKHQQYLQENSSKQKTYINIYQILVPFLALVKLNLNCIGCFHWFQRSESSGVWYLEPLTRVENSNQQRTSHATLISWTVYQNTTSEAQRNPALGARYAMTPGSVLFAISWHNYLDHNHIEPQCVIIHPHVLYQIPQTWTALGCLLWNSARRTQNLLTFGLSE